MKKKVRFLIMVCVLTAGVLTGCSWNGKASSKVQYQAVYYDIFDTITTIMGYASSEEEFYENADAIYQQLKQYHQWFDIYHDYEENNLKTINDNAGICPVEVNEEIMTLLLECRQYYEITDKKVNVAMGSVLVLWQEARQKALSTETSLSGEEILPHKEQLTEAVKHCSFDTVIIEEEAKTVYLADEKQRLDVGAVAKGWAAERVSQNAPKGYLISVGGNVCVTGKKPDGSLWKIGIQNPKDSSLYAETVEISKGSVVTSGDYQRCFEADGKKYHHLIDPKTCYPAEKWSSVTVMCQDSGLADALSTALFLMTKEEGEKLLKQYQASAVWIGQEGDIFYSEDFEKKQEK